MNSSIASRFIRKFLLASAIAGVGLGLTSCDSVIYDDQGDCSVHYRLSFTYTANPMLLTSPVPDDAFGSQVNSLNIGIYDQEGRMVFHAPATRDLTTDNSYYLEVDVLPGTYDILAWCEGESNVDKAVAFDLSGQNMGDQITESGASITLNGSEEDLYFDRPLRPLFYGALNDVEFPSSYGNVNLPAIPLIKDTNRILIQLQNMDGLPLDPENVSFEIEARNSTLNYLNELNSDTNFVYRPWAVRAVTTQEEEDEEDEETESRATIEDQGIPSGIQAEFSTGRILEGVEQWLVVRQAQSGEIILRVPMVEYLLLVRGYYEERLSPQDYLDACDNYSMVFFIDENYTWIKSQILINNWRIVPPQEEIL